MPVKNKFKRLIAGICTCVFVLSAMPAGDLKVLAEEIAAQISDTSSQLYGDVNNDGVIDAADVKALTEAIEAGTADTMPAADVNADKTVNSADLDMITGYANGELTYFPVGEYYNPDAIFMTRAEWINTLVVKFDMTVEDTSTVNEYFTDVAGHKYEYQINLAANFGVFDIDSETFVPDAYVTREFAAHTMNFCLGFSADTEPTFSDADEVVYAGDAEIAVERNWIQLVGTEFRPDLYAVKSETDAAIADADQILLEAQIAENPENVLVTSSDVIALEETATAEMSGNTLTVTGSSMTVSDGDTFSVNLGDNKIVRKAVTVSTDEETGVMTIETEMPDESAIEEENASGYGYIDYDNIQVVDENFTMTVVDEEPSEQSVSSANNYAAAPYWKKEDTIQVNTKKLNLNGKIPVKGGTITVTGGISKLSVPYCVETSGLSIKKLKVGADAVATVKGTLSTSMSSEFSQDILVGFVPVFASGALNIKVNVYLSISVSGEISIKYSADFGGAVEYTKKNGWRIDKYFHSRGFEVEAKVEEKIGAKLSISVDALGRKLGEFYLFAGEKGVAHAVKHSNGMECVDISACFVAEIGAKFSLPFGVKWEKSYQFINSGNSPLHINMHVENGSRVNSCTYGKTSGTTGGTSYVGSKTSDGGTVTSNGRIIYKGKSGNVKKAKGSTSHMWTGSYTPYTQTFAELTPPTVISEPTVLEEDMTCNYGLTINSDLDLNGHKVTVKGNVTLNDAVITLNKGTMDVSGDFNMKNWWPQVKFEYKEDTLIIGGDYDDRNATQPTFLHGIAGTLEFKGDVYCNGLSFSNLHKTIFSGTEDQNVYLADGWGNFNIVEIKNSDSKKICVDNKFSADGATVIDGITLHLENTNNISGDNAQIKLSNCSAENLIIDGDIGLDNLEFTGKTITTNGNISTKNQINMNGCTWNCNGNLTVGNDQTESISIDGGILNVDGDVNNRTNNFNMKNKKDVVNITGDFINNMWCYSFTNGVLKIGGSIIANEDIHASENHRTILTGEKDCDLYMAESNSYLNYLEIENSDKRKFTVDSYFRANYTNCGENPLNIITDDIPGKTGSISFGELTCSELNTTGTVSFYESNDFKGSIITVGGDANISGDFKLNGAEMTVKKNVTQNDGTADLSGGKLTVPGGFTQSGGTLDINGGNLDIAGDLSLKGKLLMNTAKDMITVAGDFDADYYGCSLTDGTIEVAGNYADTGENCIISSGDFRFVLTGDKDQTIKIDYYPTNGEKYHFANLVINNSDSRNIILAAKLDAKEITCDGKEVNITSKNGILNNFKLRQPVNITGDVAIEGNTLDLNGNTVTVKGNVYQHSGKVLPNTGKLDISGNYLMVTDEDSAVYGVSEGILSMINDGDYVKVGGDFITNTSQNHTKHLTAGILEILGDFHQMAKGTTFAFPAGGTHITYLSGSEKQNVTFDSYSDSHFNSLILKEDESNYVFNENPCWNELGSGTVTTAPVTTQPSVTTTTTVTVTTSPASGTDVTDVPVTSTTVSVITSTLPKTSSGLTLPATSTQTVTETDTPVTTVTIPVTTSPATETDVTDTPATTVTIPATSEPPVTTTPVEPPETVYDVGDPNGDSNVNMLDVILIAKSIMGKVKLTPAQQNAADMNGDGRVNILDAIALAKFIMFIQKLNV